MSVLISDTDGIIPALTTFELVLTQPITIHNLRRAWRASRRAARAVRVALSTGGTRARAARRFSK